VRRHEADGEPVTGHEDPELLEHAHVVATGPMLDKCSNADPPDVYERPRCRSTGDRRVGEQRHRGWPMGAVQRHVPDDEGSLTDEVVLLQLGRSEVDLDGAQDRPETIAAVVRQHG
jgi:hypothetical protein